VLGAGTTDTKVVAGIITDGTSKVTLGVAGTSVGSIDLKNATSGTITLAPVTGALGTVTVSVPATTGTLYISGGTDVAVADGGTGLSSGTSGGVLAFTAAGTIASSGALAANAIVIGGGAGVAPSTTTTGTGVVTALGVNTGSAGAVVVNGGALGTPSSGTVTNLTGTASININGTVGATTPGAAGATLAFGDLIYLDPTDSRWELADANSAAAADGDSRGLIGICVLAAAADGSATTILLQGIVRADAAFPDVTIGAPVYVSETAGDIVVTQVTTTDAVIRIMGYGMTINEIYFAPAGSWTTHN
jgi:hypothetical protein